jgi:hypothetical protein
MKAIIAIGLVPSKLVIIIDDWEYGEVVFLLSGECDDRGISTRYC